MSRKTDGEELAGDVDFLVDEIGGVVRAVAGGEKPGDADPLVDRVSKAVRAAVGGKRLTGDIDALADRVNKTVRAAVGGEKPAGDVDALADRVNKIVRTAAGGGSGAAEVVGQSLKDRIRLMVDGVRGTGRDSVVMVRVNRDSQQRMDELIEVKLVSSRSEAAAFLIAEGIRSRQGLFEGIASKIDAIRKAREELQTLLDEEEARHA